MCESKEREISITLPTKGRHLLSLSKVSEEIKQIIISEATEVAVLDYFEVFRGNTICDIVKKSHLS